MDYHWKKININRWTICGYKVYTIRPLMNIDKVYMDRPSVDSDKVYIDGPSLDICKVYIDEPSVNIDKVYIDEPPIDQPFGIIYALTNNLYIKV